MLINSKFSPLIICFQRPTELLFNIHLDSIVHEQIKGFRT